jgi:hypothetical protein
VLCTRVCRGAVLMVILVVIDDLPCAGRACGAQHRYDGARPTKVRFAILNYFELTLIYLQAFALTVMGPLAGAAFYTPT